MEDLQVSEAQLFATMFKYKAWANNEILMAMRLIDEQAHAAGRHLAIRILNHTYVVDQIFAANLRRLPHKYTGPNTRETPTLEELSDAVRASDKWYQDFVAGLAPEDFSESIDFVFTDGDPGRMSRTEMLTHIVVHGEYHRGCVGRILVEHSIDGPEAFAAYLHKAEPARRRR
jgi:uncharacterized damage-inducible protein DinB